MNEIFVGQVTARGKDFPSRTNLVVHFWRTYYLYSNKVDTGKMQGILLYTEVGCEPFFWTFWLYFIIL